MEKLKVTGTIKEDEKEVLGIVLKDLDLKAEDIKGISHVSRLMYLCQKAKLIINFDYNANEFTVFYVTKFEELKKEDVEVPGMVTEDLVNTTANINNDDEDDSALDDLL